MKISEKWLRELIPLKVSTETLLEDLTFLGLEVEGIEQKNKDSIIELALTPNRGDCLSMEGIARDLSAYYHIQTNPILIPSITSKSKLMLIVKLEAPKACAHYVGRIIENIDSNAKTPDYINERLENNGIRSIAPVVDVTNYVMLELGQPMHAFDLKKLNQAIVVRYAQPGEEIQLLDKSNQSLDSETLVIADNDKPHAIAGVMGGLESAVGDNTKHILLESAFFDPVSIRWSARKYRLSTDSSYRFERGVDFNLQRRAIERATEILLTIVGGKAGPIVEQTHKKALPKRKPILLRADKVRSILGFEISNDQITDILKRLNLEVVQSGNNLDVLPPSYRFDLEIEMDFIEEIARMYGYQNVPTKTPNIPAKFLPYSETDCNIRLFKKVLVHRGYQEAVTYSFVSKEVMQKFLPEERFYTLSNPIASDLSVMRASLLPGLVKTLVYNLHRQQTRIRLFESGLQFTLDTHGVLHQTTMLAGVCCGSVQPVLWGNEKRTVDFYDVKGDVEALLKKVNLLEKVIFDLALHPSFHPSQTASVFLNGKCIGYVGALHPRISQHLEIQTPVFLFELESQYIKSLALPTFQAVSKFPSITRDLAIVVKVSVLALELKSAILSCVGDCLVGLRIFDVYQGKGIAPGKKSLGIELVLQEATRTLMDEEVNVLIEKILLELKKQFKATLRV